MEGYYIHIIGIPTKDQRGRTGYATLIYNYKSIIFGSEREMFQNGVNLAPIRRKVQGKGSSE